MILGQVCPEAFNSNRVSSPYAGGSQPVGRKGGNDVEAM